MMSLVSVLGCGTWFFLIEEQLYCSCHYIPNLAERTVMTTAQGGYAPIQQWVTYVLGTTHTTVVITVVWAVRCLLVAQRVTSAALARA